jgi:glutathione S-transferase
LADIAITSQLINFMHAGESINNTQWPTLAAYFERMLSQPIWRALVEREQITLNKMHQAQAVL